MQATKDECKKLQFNVDEGNFHNPYNHEGLVLHLKVSGLVCSQGSSQIDLMKLIVATEKMGTL